MLVALISIHETRVSARNNASFSGMQIQSRKPQAVGEALLGVSLVPRPSLSEDKHMYICMRIKGKSTVADSFSTVMLKFRGWRYGGGGQPGALKTLPYNLIVSDLTGEFFYSE